MANDDCAERYELVCRERFDRVEELQKETIGLLRGRNDKPGLMDEVRELKRWRDTQAKSRAARIALVTGIALIVLTQVVILLRELVLWRAMSR